MCLNKWKIYTPLYGKTLIVLVFIYKSAKMVLIVCIFLEKGSNHKILDWWSISTGLAVNLVPLKIEMTINTFNVCISLFLSILLLLNKEKAHIPTPLSLSLPPKKKLIDIW